MRVIDIRTKFQELLSQRKLTSINREASMTDLVGNSTIEIVGANFIADEDAIFGEVNLDYVRREEEWYYSQSLNVNDIPNGPPIIWKAVADKDGYINSNYGWCVFSKENGSQFERVIKELSQNPESRRAIMIYTRPTMWLDYNRNGRSDFMCTNAVQYLIRDGAVHAVVQMRSNDAVFGYKNDRHWQHHMLKTVIASLPESYDIGNIYWHVGSLHVYSRHFYLIDPSFK